MTASSDRAPAVWPPARRLLDGLLAVVGMHVLVILATGGYALGTALAPPVMHLLALAALRVAAAAAGWRGLVVHERAAFFFVCLAIYLVADGRIPSSGDALPARYLPLSLLREGDFDLDEFPWLYTPGAPFHHQDGIPYYVQRVRGHHVSAYPVGGALLAVPFYVPSALGGMPLNSSVVAEVEELAASTLVTLSALLLYAILRRLTSRGLALTLTVAYALGTSSLSVSSRALWQHGPSQFALAAALYCLVRGRTEPRWVLGAGFTLALAVITRPSDALVALPLAVYVLAVHPRQIVGFLASGLPPVAFQLWYGARYFGDPFHTQLPILAPGLWSMPFWQGLAGILLSPGRGLFIYSPIFLFAVAGMGFAWRKGGEPALLRALSVGVVLTIGLYAKWVNWWGGDSYGPRLLADLSPALVLLVVPLRERLVRSRGLRWLFGVLLAWSIAAHAIGAFLDDGSWNVRVDVARHPERLWSWTDNQLVNPLRAALAALASAAAR